MLHTHSLPAIEEKSLPATQEKKNKKYGREQAIWSVSIETFHRWQKRLVFFTYSCSTLVCTICTSLQMYRERGRNSFTGGLWIAIRDTAHDTEDNAHWAQNASHQARSTQQPNREPVLRLKKKLWRFHPVKVEPNTVNGSWSLDIHLYIVHTAWEKKMGIK